MELIASDNSLSIQHVESIAPSLFTAFLYLGRTKACFLLGSRFYCLAYLDRSLPLTPSMRQDCVWRYCVLGKFLEREGLWMKEAHGGEEVALVLTRWGNALTGLRMAIFSALDPASNTNTSRKSLRVRSKWWWWEYGALAIALQCIFAVGSWRGANMT